MDASPMRTIVKYCSCSSRRLTLDYNCGVRPAWTQRARWGAVCDGQRSDSAHTKRTRSASRTSCTACSRLCGRSRTVALAEGASRVQSFPTSPRAQSLRQRAARGPSVRTSDCVTRSTDYTWIGYISSGYVISSKIQVWMFFIFLLFDYSNYSLRTQLKLQLAAFLEATTFS